MIEFNYELIKRIRAKFEIEDELQCYDCNNYIWAEMVEKFKPTTISSRMEISNLKKPTEELSINKNFGYIKKDNFVLVNVEHFTPDGAFDCCFLFTNNVEGFYKKYLKGKVQPPKKFQIKAGVFKPYQTMSGWHLSPVPLGKTMKPILNHDLFKLLRNEIEAFTKKEDVYKKLGIDYKRGIMLYGDCGNGKTTFLKHLLHDLDDAICVLMNIQDDNLISFMEYFLELDDAKDFLKIVVIEDIDGMHSNNRSALLNFLDGLREIHKTIFIATTNFPDKVDIALMERPSRFDSVYKIGVPNSNSRKKLLRFYFKDLNNSDLDKCVVASKGFSGAFFKEFYLMSKLSDLQPLEAINEVRRRRELK